MPPKKDAKGSGSAKDKGGKSGGKGAKAAEVKGMFFLNIKKKVLHLHKCYPFSRQREKRWFRY